MTKLSQCLISCVLLVICNADAARILYDDPELTYVPDLTCCYGKRLLHHGEIALSLPECCLQLKCSFGLLKLEQIGPPGSTYCCEFDGQIYPPGYELNHCYPLVCTHGEWHYLDHIDDCCKHCALYNDPHIITFDDHSYDWHDDCNYTVTQNDLTYNPEVGVFSDFVRCWGCASCLGQTTFRNDPHTILTLRNGAVFDVLVNGDPFNVPFSGVHVLTSSGGTHPVLVWRNKHCIILLGSSRLVLQHCRNRLDIWAHPSHADNLDGLCGHYNFYIRDDFTDRQGNVHDLEYRPSEFPMSWKTNDQSDPHCKRHYNAKPSYGCPTGNPCRAGKVQFDEYLSTCKKYLNAIIGKRKELLYLIDSCAFDICMMTQNGESPRTIKEWLRELQDNAEIAKDNVIKTTGRKPSAPVEVIDVHPEPIHPKPLHPKPVHTIHPKPVHPKPLYVTPSYSLDYIDPRQTFTSHEPSFIDGFATIVTYDSPGATLTLPRLTDVYSPVPLVGASPEKTLMKEYATIVVESPSYTSTPLRPTDVRSPHLTVGVDLHVSPTLTLSKEHVTPLRVMSTTYPPNPRVPNLRVPGLEVTPMMEPHTDDSDLATPTMTEYMEPSESMEMIYSATPTTITPVVDIPRSNVLHHASTETNYISQGPSM
ncbi:uncharacterized protein [Panulirus ornatus]|uniref:uncharacterized protein n=1 Tax=Panulirus ornatus TaxID=150431 RepID=UPI003A888250